MPLQIAVLSMLPIVGADPPPTHPPPSPPRPPPNLQIVVLSMLPIVDYDVVPTNAKYAALAATQGAAYIDCTAGMDPTDTELFEDGIHPTPAGHEKVLACLRPALEPLLAAAA